MEFGTPEEDAFRRDATVNALFFHLRSQQVVDLTRRGLDDLQAKLIRTPLDPFHTFMEDPLRVLRLIRIASKLQFTIHESTMDCMRNDEVQEALDKIITRDRINIEVFKMAKTAPTASFCQLFECNLFIPTFLRFGSPLVDALRDHFRSEDGSPWPPGWSGTMQYLDNILNSDSHLGFMARSIEDPECLWVLAAYTPLARLRSSHLQNAVQEATDALRFPVKMKKLLEASLTNFDAIQSLVEETEFHDGALPRSKVGMAVRLWGATWPSQLLFCLLAQAGGYTSHFTASTLMASFSLFAEYIWEQDLHSSYTQTPLLNGNEVKHLFDLKSDGRYIKDAIEALTNWQFDHPQASEEDARAWMLSQKESFDIPKQ